MFNEPEWLKLVFLLSDTQAWIDDLSKQAFGQLPVPDKKKFLQKNYYLGIRALAHILERHYYKIPCYPNAGKFHIPLTEIFHHIREAHSLPVTPVSGCLNFQRAIKTEQPVGFDKNGQPTTSLQSLLTPAAKSLPHFLVYAFRALRCKAGKRREKIQQLIK
ncbi:hypothetical protein [Terrimonas alba]|uniref:hypothetical protein n=1 Tax=Terrimonas alba TaxID=3349636 RepID=UPI0035F22943